MVAASTNMSLEELRRDTLVAVGLGGVVFLCIIIAAASLEGNSLTNAAELGEALAPLYERQLLCLCSLVFCCWLDFGFNGSHGCWFCGGRVFLWSQKFRAIV